MPAVTICVTGAAGQIAYSLLPMLCGGRTFGPEQKIRLHLMDIPPALEALGGVKMELEDAAFPLLESVSLFTDAEEAFKGTDFCVMLGAFPRQKGMERKDLLQKNAGIFSAQGAALEKAGNKNVKIVVVGNPANTNCGILRACAPSVPAKNFSALTRLDHNRAHAQIALRTGSQLSDVKNVCIWGNHSSTQFPDISHGTVSGQSVSEKVADDEWLQGEFIKTVQTRGAAVIAARKLSSAMSAAIAISDHLHDWVLGSSEDDFVSMAVPSDGSYGIDEGIVYSFPVICKGGDYTIVQGLEISEFARNKMTVTLAELKEEMEQAKQFI